MTVLEYTKWCIPQLNQKKDTTSSFHESSAQFCCNKNEREEISALLNFHKLVNLTLVIYS